MALNTQLWVDPNVASPTIERNGYSSFIDIHGKVYSNIKSSAGYVNLNGFDMSGKIYLEFREIALNITFGLVSAIYKDSLSNGSYPFGSSTTNNDIFMFRDECKYIRTDGNVDNTALSNKLNTAVTDTVMLALDSTTGEIWIGKNGVWVDDPTTEPATWVLASGQKWRFYMRQYSATPIGSLVTLPLNSEDYIYTPPTGFDQIVPEKGVEIEFDETVPSTPDIFRVTKEGLLACSTSTTAVEHWIRSKNSFSGKIYIECDPYHNSAFMGICANEYSCTGNDLPIGTNVDNPAIGKVVMTLLSNRLYYGNDHYNSISLGSLTPGQTYKTLQIAIDTVAGKVWIGVNGTWLNPPGNVNDATLDVTPNLEWCLVGRNSGSYYHGRYVVSEKYAKFNIPSGFKTASPQLQQQGFVVDNQGVNISGIVRSYRDGNGELVDEANVTPESGFTVVVPDEESYVTCKAEPGYLTLATDPDLNPITFDFGAGGEQPAFTTPILVGMVNQPNVDDGTSKTINRPAEVQEGDLLILFVGHRSDITDSITSAGFTLYHFEEDTSTDAPQQDTSIYTKIATDNEPATYTVNVTSTSRIMLSMAAMRDCKIDNATYDSYEGETPWTSTTPTPGEDKLQLLNVHWVNSDAVVKTPTFNPANSVSLPESSQNIIRNFIGSLNTQSDVIVDGLDLDYRGRLSRLSFVGLPLTGFKSMIRGNVTRLNAPYGSDIIGLSTIDPPSVVGVTKSNSTTGDYELDVAPYQGRCNVVAIPDYGLEFVAGASLLLDAVVRPTVPNGYLYRVIEAGTTDVTEPTWPTVENQLVVSGGVTMITEYMLRPLVNSLLLPVIEPI